MLKISKKILGLFLVLAALFVVAYIYFGFIDKGAALSEAQMEIKEILGEPELFSITYLPQGSGEGSAFVRHEIWFYPNQSKKAVFLEGKLISLEEYVLDNAEDYWPTPYHPEDFDVYTDKAMLERILDGESLEPVELPGFFGDGVETYASPGAVFVYENGYLTYMETVD